MSRFEVEVGDDFQEGGNFSNLPVDERVHKKI